MYGRGGEKQVDWLGLAGKRFEKKSSQDRLLDYDKLFFGTQEVISFFPLSHTCFSHTCA